MGFSLGFGRPGWHLECSAMSQKTLGVPFDIHSGGQDLIFPHHENELAQSCGANGGIEDSSSYARYWVHNGMIKFDGDKMSKSLGNILYINDLLKEYDGEVLRYVLLSTCLLYTSPSPRDLSTSRMPSSA